MDAFWKYRGNIGSPIATALIVRFHWARSTESWSRTGDLYFKYTIEFGRWSEKFSSW